MKGLWPILPSAMLLAAAPALAQPADLPIAPATTDVFPPGVKVIKSPSGSVFANDKGVTLYGMDMRVLWRAGSDPSQFCKGECAAQWEPLLAPPGTKPNLALPRGFGRPAPFTDWMVMESAAGAQWVYKGWHLVFVRKGDKPGTTTYEGAEDLTWNTLKFVPPAPKIVAPQTVSTRWRDKEYVLADKEGRVLFTGSCKKTCADWHPLPAPAAGRDIGEWSVSRTGDVPQWTWRGKPVFFSMADDPATLPASARVLKP
ncbi:hypothetical protein [Novosphingobium sp. TH158]|uniref:hypothetical protein n=1 Tax=Novosphingobium sp. TH158 TaxID=2067455 RepID=UPI000C7DF0D2|nr:hypothetical protein [Novosphingobium sp. TH158]PLK26203.1 hypothetical protein C0V78_04370 [Novosphingobium sp. TH158]